eukprot:GHVR01133472.1.p2 GENE.GHVR01133472.1~~GHVR01133472.1.p2  ORF type:complete len:192 (+),score=27.95 GHVR01133472.1:53-628(+)
MRRSTRRRSTFADKASNKASNWLSLISSSLNEAYDSVSQTLSQCGGDRQRGSMQGSDNQDDILSNLLFGSKLAAVSEGSYEDDNTDTCSSSSNPRTTGTNNNKKDEISTKSRADSISSASEVSHTQHHPTRGGKMPLCCISSVEPIGAREFLVRANDSQTSSVLLLRAPDSACRDKWTRSLVELANQESGI